MSHELRGKDAEIGERGTRDQARRVVGRPDSSAIRPQESSLERTSGLRRALFHPIRSIPLAYLLVIIAGAALLLLPASHAASEAGSGITEASELDAVMSALFTSVSAVCLVGLSTVDTATYWSPFGQTVILVLVQLGGFGIMAVATLLTTQVRKGVGVRGTLVTEAETQTPDFGDVRAVLLRVARITVITEGIVLLLLAARLWFEYDHNLGPALWHGLFQSVSAFNNAGFTLYTGNVAAFGGDPWIVVPVCVAVIVGGLGLPVIVALSRDGLRLRKWTVHVRLTVFGTLFLILAGALLFGAFEWNRPGTLGQMDSGGKVLESLSGSVFPRTAGFSGIDYGAASPETLLVTNLLMFIGGGSAGTAGGIKITTFLILGYAIWTEVRGREDVTIGNRSISPSVQRQALSVALIGLGTVLAGTLLLLMLTDFGLERVLFEAVSAFSASGLSTGITHLMPESAQWVLMALMFIGRIGTITVASALALSSHPRLFRLPEERPIIG